MQPPLRPGTTLHRRYKITKLLGQGGFGRTYLAEDEGRFNEICVLKEYMPASGSDYALEKSKELFNREAQTLYQLRHPQVPQLHATFEEGERLFLVQDYIEGSTFRQLLDKRLAQQQVFSESEAFQFLQQMLPVLEYIHSKGIIHRDIAPDNIILRQQDNLPVLIDFGIVKDITHLDLLEEEVENATTVGKLGYAPSEQLQTGKIFPSSDIYALAVTTVVLLTGRKSQDLKDEENMRWRWHQWLPHLTPQFAQILNRMLSSKPRNRYPSASEAAQALRTLDGLIPPSTGPRTVTPSLMPPTQGTSKSSNSSSAPISVSAPAQFACHGNRSSSNVIVQQQQNSGQLPEWAMPMIGLGVACIGVVALMQMQPSSVIANLSTNPSNTPRQLETSPRLTTQPFPKPTRSSTSFVTPPDNLQNPPVETDPLISQGATETQSTLKAQVFTEPINFNDQGGRVQVTGRVDAQRVQRYQLYPHSGHRVIAQILKGDSATLHIRDANKSLESGITNWQSPVVDRSGMVVIDVEADVDTDYLLELSVSPTE